MDMGPAYPSLSERVTNYWERGVRIATRFAIAFGLAVLSGIGIGFAVAHNVLAQIFITLLSAFALWLPFVIGIARFEGWRNARRHRQALAALPIAQQANRQFEKDWQRLLSLAPADASVTRVYSDWIYENAASSVRPSSGTMAPVNSTPSMLPSAALRVTLRSAPLITSPVVRWMFL